MLQSDKDKGYYVGITTNIEKRLASHNAGATRSTKHRRPFRLIYVETHATRLKARNREVFLKSYAGVGEKLDILKNCQIV